MSSNHIFDPVREYNALVDEIEHIYYKTFPGAREKPIWEMLSDIENAASFKFMYEHEQRIRLEQSKTQVGSILKALLDKHD